VTILCRSSWHAPEYRIQFSPIQAVRLTTEDAFELPNHPPPGVVEVTNSPWLCQLAKVVAKVDHDATFMARSHHYFINGYGEVLDVAAFTLTIERRPTAQIRALPQAIEAELASATLDRLRQIAIACAGAAVAHVLSPPALLVQALVVLRAGQHDSAFEHAVNELAQALEHDRLTRTGVTTVTSLGDLTSARHQGARLRIGDAPDGARLSGPGHSEVDDTLTHAVNAVAGALIGWDHWKAATRAVFESLAALNEEGDDAVTRVVQAIP
jgi:hypothetical protein